MEQTFKFSGVTPLTEGERSNLMREAQERGEIHIPIGDYKIVRTKIKLNDGSEKEVAAVGNQSFNGSRGEASFFAIALEHIASGKQIPVTWKKFRVQDVSDFQGNVRKITVANTTNSPTFKVFAEDTPLSEIVEYLDNHLDAILSVYEMAYTGRNQYDQIRPTRGKIVYVK